MNIHTFPSLVSVVEHGKELGRTLGFPTLNCSGRCNISSGTYKVRILIDGRFFSGMGVYFSENCRCEVHAFGMQGLHWYGKEIIITFLQKIRDNKSFDTLEQLKYQLEKDKKYCTDITWHVCTFGSFDLLHAGHRAYLTYAKQQGDHLTTIVASDESIQRIKSHAPQYSQIERIKHLEDISLIDSIIAGHPTNFFTQLKVLPYKVLVFGYDQNTQGVESWYRTQSLPLPFFIQANSYHPTIFKSSKLKKKVL